MSSSDPKLTISDLDLCAPLFKKGTAAEEGLLIETVYSPEDLLALETLVETKRLVFDYLISQSDGLIRQEVGKLLKTSVLPDAHDAFNQIYYAGVKGFAKGLAKYSPSAKKTSPTNYLFQWVFTYAKRELMSVEAPLGMPPTRYERLKKVAAVRRKLNEKLGRKATNQELLEFFHSGGADVANKIGRVSNAGKPSQANLRMKLEDMEEQEDLEKRMHIRLIDIQDPVLSERAFKTEDQALFDETLFGAFVAQHKFTDKAIAVLRSELRDGSDPSLAELASVDSMSDREYRRLARLWSDFLSDPSSPFVEFLKSRDSDDREFDLTQLAGSSKPAKHYRDLYEDSK